MAKGVYVGAPNFAPVTLPSGYTQLEYIQSSGTQYIDTGYVITSENMRVVIKFAYTAAHSDATLFGSETTGITGSGEYSICPYANPQFFVGGSKSLKSAYEPSLNEVCTLDITANNGTLTDIWNGTRQNSQSYTQSLNHTYSVAVFGNNVSGAVTQKVSMKLYSFQIYDGNVLVRDYIPCKNPDSTIGLYDLVNSVFHTNAGSGIFTAGATYTDVAHKVKKIYLGINNIARKVKKGYIGIGGIARPFWSGGELTYYGTVTALSTGRYSLAATMIGDYALFGGGKTYSSGSASNAVDAYNTSLTRTTPTALNTARYALAATMIGDYALFGGGRTGNAASASSNVVDAYNTSLTRTTATVLSTGRSQLAATTIGNYALFGGGEHSENASNVVDAYNTSLTRTTATALSTGRYSLAATMIGDYALFGGGGTGITYYALNAVDAYNTSLTRTTATVLSTARYQLAATTIGNYALFGGGEHSENASNAVDAYNTSLTRTTPTALNTARYALAATMIGDYALFGGGRTGNAASASSNAVDAYNTSLTRTTATVLSTGRIQLAATTIGNYALFGGGFTSQAPNAVDAYTVA